MTKKRYKELIVGKKPEICPSCGFYPVGEIIYGYPVWDEVQQRGVEEGSIIIGGCCMFDGQPQWACKNCGCEFRVEGEEIEE